MLIHNAVLTGSLTLPSLLPITGSLIMTGSIGIGTVSPTARLHISGTTGVLFETDGVNGVNALFVSSSGNIGIGTSTPSNLLNIVGANYIFNLSGGGASRIAGAVNNTAGNLEWGLEGSTGNQLFTGAAAYTANIGTSNNTSFNLCTNTNVRMIISGSGQIGIGTAPSAWSTANSLKPIQNPAGTFWNFDVGNLYVGLNYYYDGTNRRYVNSSEYATEYQQNGSHIFFTAPVGTAGNVVTLTEKMRITNDGYLRLASSGIQFNGDTAAANSLNDYEEGIIAATVTCGTSGTVTLDGGYNSLAYVKVGSIVHVTGLLYVNSVSSPVGSFSVPLPFAVANLSDAAGTAAANVHIDNAVSANSSAFCAIVNETESSLRVYLGNTTTLSGDSAQQLKSTSSIYISVTYRTS